ncbi:Flp family type IVb pilin [Sphingomonas sp. ACRSK]|uniref:Flp family type IVb pilin n=1 Tax=Sphingomonas sp. ACRSK TaxID=2918213 RepID=UPI001EF73746|nr:Flp family type IVb pilin [Sphingomonas sp. ACRSK]MCG7348647.1 Flp family type IVb pilin [Sphingomonas sp. ACRSK]
MRVIASLARRLLRDRRGATMVEYALIIALIALAALATLTPLSRQVVGMWDHADEEVSDAVQR